MLTCIFKLSDPGVACDVPAVFYSFSFSPKPKWTAFYPTGPEIHDYLQDVCNKFELIDKIELNTEVLSCRWIASEEVWEVDLQHLVQGTGDLAGRLIEKSALKSLANSVYSLQGKL
jgi:cation diffusion facilitator CzcD-associated flavoprotein CzcO